MTNEAPWWQRGVLYQIYPRSFADSNGDGAGDISGIIDHLDHLEWLGVDGIWISPVTVSPNADWGYDVGDFCAIQPDLGTMGDLDRLIAEADRRGIRILMDLVPNHTSEEHPWFVDSRSSLDAAHRDWYVWADAKADGSLPNNWVSSFGGPAWTLEETTGQYYLHNHLAEQPDLNWWNEGVRDAMDEVIRFWFDRGVAGFRIDVCNVIVKDALLRDNPPATKDDDFDAQMFGQRPVFSSNRPEVHDVIRRWRSIADAYDPARVLVGETPVPVETLAKYYGRGNDELHLAFNFPFIGARLEVDAMREIVRETEATLPPGAWPAWTGSNHDMGRFPTRWAEDDPARVRVAATVLLCLRGTPVLYQGDEIGQGNVQVDREHLRDPLGVRYWPHYEGRDQCRTPMQWRDGPGGGFTDPAATPWLPLGDTSRWNVESQRDDPDSMLRFVRDLIALRRRTPDLNVGASSPHPAPDGVWAWRRGERHAVVVNMTDGDVGVPGLEGHVLIATDRRLDGVLVDAAFSIGPWQGVVVELSNS